MKKFILFSICALFLIVITSCGKNSCDLIEITSKTKKVSEAAIKFSTDQSKANCEAYVKALNDYVKSFEGCEGVSKEQIDEYKKIAKETECK